MNSSNIYDAVDMVQKHLDKYPTYCVPHVAMALMDSTHPYGKPVDSYAVIVTFDTEAFPLVFTTFTAAYDFCKMLRDRTPITIE